MRGAFVASISLLVACNASSPTKPLLVIPGEATAADFYDLPFPNDLRRNPDGTLDLSEFPTNALIVDTYRQAAQALDGFGKNSPAFFRFTDDLDPSTLPATPEASLADDASVYLIDLATRARVPSVATFYADKTMTIGPHHLAVRPYPGFPLDDATAYAVVITDRVHDIYGDPLAPADGWALIAGHGGSTHVADARAVYQPLLDALDAGGGRADVVDATVFTTQHSMATVPALRKAIYAAAAPVATGVTAGTKTNPAFAEYVGTYDAPNFQRGTVPYHDSGGDIVIGADGAAVVQRMESLRFAFTVPTAAAPPAGYPVVIYQHGTGGDYESFVDDGTAASLAQSGLAAISMDQVLHGPRNPGGDAELDFFNFANPLAARDNALQGAADGFSQHRLLASLPAAVGHGLKLDLTHVYFFGHSQGGSTGPGFVTFEPDLAGAVFSGTGGNLTLGLLAKTEPLNIPDLVTTFVRDDPVDVNNPSLALVQTWMDRADPVNFAPLMVRQPPAGQAPRNIYQTEGYTDHYAPNPGIEAFATALGGDLALVPMHHDLEGITLRGGTTRALPFSHNAAGGTATATLAQFDQLAGSDGHFVVFDIPLARKQAAEFLGTLARTGTATVVAQ